MTAIDLANAEQLAASDPAVSAFVAASAGSGKTKLLTDRLLRLMLGGADPARILCLTYTKAAAAEMRIRLNRRLGAWVAMPDAELSAKLDELAVAPDAATLARARQLFADVLDLPGGMRIETIHAFCQSLLRRFPLEARLSPHFELADETETASRLREAREAVLSDAVLRAPVTVLAAETTEQGFAELLAKYAEHGAPEGADIALQRAALGANETDIPAILRNAVCPRREPEIRAALKILADRGNPSGKTWANRALAWLGQDIEARAAAWDDWVGIFLTKEGLPNKLHNFFGKNLAAEEPALRAELAAVCDRIGIEQERLKAARLAHINAALAALVAPARARDETAKQLAARLSYGDLIRYAEKLFEDPGAAWVLYKLDGGIEHLLLDEVQDTAPAQWEIAAKIADEFFAGESARPGGRTLFAVGDSKQSIFSFQGADLTSFSKYRALFEAKVQAAGQNWYGGGLSVSFRSTAPVLALVDKVFESGPACAGVVPPGETLHHGVSRAGQAGRVTLWPLHEAEAAEAPPDWMAAARYQAAKSAKAKLAEDIADWIAGRLAARTPLPSRGRAVQPGDFLILVRQRDALVAALTRECKARNIPIAGLDRLTLTATQAVSDVLALCDALLLPEDDLAFAQYLVSPLGGLTDESLMALALGRHGTLLATLYRRAADQPDWTAAKHYFEALRQKVDFLTPFALLSEALGPLGGAARLRRRLGAEAAEPLDELLAEALAFSQREPGALQLFIHGLRQAGAEIKREPEAGANMVRVMTVHGAKGLQAPIVILPDTTSLPKGPARETIFWLTPPQQRDAKIPIFCPRAALRCESVANAAAAATAAAAEEYNRLLYVALTRAEDELLICGAKGRNKLPEACWYESARAGFVRLGAQDAGDGHLIFESPQTAAPDRASKAEITQTTTLPAWAGAAPNWTATPPAAETTRPERIAPSRGTEDQAREAIAASPLGTGLEALRSARATALERGRAVHALLQHLPALPPAARHEAARGYLTQLPALAGQAGAIADSVLAIFALSELAPLFGPGSAAEIPLAGVIGDVEIGGLVDRLVITEDAVLIADYKTDRAPPSDPAAIPPNYLRQLAAYRAILAQIHPAKAVHGILIWTASAQVMPIPPALLDAHAPA